MGNSIWPRSGRVGDLNATANTYRFPSSSKSGCYFADHFILSGKTFEGTNEDVFLFGENDDLNYLSENAVPFPYPLADKKDTSSTIRCFVHLRKESLRMVKMGTGVDGGAYKVEFVFDADLNCSIQIFLMATETFVNDTIVYIPRCESFTSKLVHFEKGTNQTYSSEGFVVQPNDFTPSELNYKPGENSEIPLIIQITVDDQDLLNQSESTIAQIEPHSLQQSNGMYTLKFLKQKIMTDGVCFMLQDLYGIRKRDGGAQQEDDRSSENDNIFMCVICWADMRDTIMLPCRHLCLCSDCAETIKTRLTEPDLSMEERRKLLQCPLCRRDFYALLQIKVHWKNCYVENCTCSELDTDEVPVIKVLNGMLEDVGNNKPEEEEEEIENKPEEENEEQHQEMCGAVADISDAQPQGAQRKGSISETVLVVAADLGSNCTHAQILTPRNSTSSLFSSSGISNALGFKDTKV